MTTRPEAKLYHISREEAARKPEPDDEKPDLQVEVRRGKAAAARAAATRADDDASSLLLGGAETDDGFGDLSIFDKGNDQPADKGKTAKPAAQDQVKAEFDLQAATEAVKAEEIPPRKLRVAQRIAALHEISADTPEAAVALLRQRGIDPFHRETLRRAVADEAARANARPSPNERALVTHGANVPARQRGDQLPAKGGQPKLPTAPSSVMTEERRAAEIFQIQRDIAKRRRKRLVMLLARLAVFVILPTIITGWYYFTQATPLYATHSQFQIQHASPSAPGGGLGSLLAGTQLATNPESVAVQSYLTSRDAMSRLENDMGFRRAFQDPSIDALTRLDPEATNEQAYKTYKSSVKIGYDPTEGVLNMEVVAPDPQLSRQFSLALIKYAEEQVDQMTARLRDDQMEGARENYKDAEEGVMSALRRVQELQKQMGILDPVAESTVVMSRISAMEGEMMQKRLELGTLESNPRPNASRVDALRGEITRLEQMIAETRRQLTEDSEIRNSLADVTGELRVAEGELETRQQLLASAAAQMESARIEATKQVRYLSLSVAPVAPDEATYPRAVQNTIIAFLIFSGIYLMLSLTASILREQVSS